MGAVFLQFGLRFPCAAERDFTWFGGGESRGRRMSRRRETESRICSAPGSIGSSI